MAVENAGAVRHHARAAQASAGASRSPAAADAGDAPSGFLSLLGAASDAADPSALDVALLAPANGAAADTPLGTVQADAGVDDAATLAAWSGLLQAPATVAASLVAAGTPGQASGAPGTDTLAVTAGQGGRGGRGGFAGGTAMAGDASTTVAGDALARAADTGAPSPATALAGAPTVPAADTAATLVPGTPHSQAAAQQLRAANVAGQAAAARAHVAASSPVATATLAAGHAALDASGVAAAVQQALVSVSGGAAVASEADGRSARGATSTVSLADGGVGRWTGLLSEFVRSTQSEAGAGSFGGGGASQERGADTPSRGGDGLGAASIGFGATGSGGAGGAGGAGAGGAGAGGEGGGFPSSGGSPSQAMAATGGMVMSPDEWLAATTPALGNGSGPQTAELTVDAFGAPVDVRISLDGSDAQVTFQSDQADTRAMLGSAVSDLQSLMRQEGLVLSGVTVNGGDARADGGAGTGQAGSGGERGADARRPARADTAASIEAVGAAPARSRAAAARGGLDLFA